MGATRRQFTLEYRIEEAHRVMIPIEPLRDVQGTLFGKRHPYQVDQARREKL